MLPAKNVSCPHFSWPTLYAVIKLTTTVYITNAETVTKP